MFTEIREWLLSFIIGVVVHRREILSQKERRGQDSLMTKLNIVTRKTKKPLIVAMVGLVGSGKSYIARELATHIGATIISGDDIRIELRKQNERYDRARAIAENAMLEVLKRGGNIILDSDFVDEKKRASLREKVRGTGARIVYVRTTCDFDVAVGRMLTAPYEDKPEDFFGGADSKWNGTPQSKGAVVKVREMWRRTPQHYRWVNKIGGQWMLKKFPFALFAEIDTTDITVWKREIKKCTEELLAL